MHSDRDIFATLISANEFELLDAAGFVVARLTTGTDATGFPLQPAYAGLQMNHLDPLTTDSSLRWTDAAGVANGNEYVQLLGPRNAAGGVDGPRVVLYRQAAFPSVRASLFSGNPGGVGATNAEVFAFSALGNYSTGMQVSVSDTLSVSSAFGLSLFSDRPVRYLTGAGGVLGGTIQAVSADRMDLGAASALVLNGGGVYLRPTVGANVEIDQGGININGNLGWYNANPVFTTAGSYIQIQNGIYVAGGISYFGTRINARERIANDTGGRVTIYRAQGAAHTWSDQQLVIEDDNANGGSQAGMAFWNPAWSSAPIWRSFGSFGDRLDCLNSANSAYAPLNASAFTVVSTERAKIELTPVDDARLLALVGNVRTHRFRNRVRPVAIRPTERFTAADARWRARGRRPLTLKPAYTVFAEHDCAVDNCKGTAADPCPIIRNDTHRLGLVAEHVHEHAPEITDLDEQALPAGLAVDQIAAVAFGAVGALLRRIESLEALVASLTPERKPPR